MKKIVIRFIYKKLSYYEIKLSCLSLIEDFTPDKRRAYILLGISCSYVMQAFEILFSDLLSDLL